jgi:prepilin-type processing-associated H-X9-DG protein
MGLACAQYEQDYDETFVPYSTNPPTYTGYPGWPGAGWMPWVMLIQPYMKNFQAVVCPSDTSSPVAPIPSYCYNHFNAGGWNGTCAGFSGNGPGNGSSGGAVSQPLAAAVSPAQTIQLAECSDYWEFWVVAPHLDSPNTNGGIPYHRHNGMGNYLFCDGHAKAFELGRTTPTMYTVEQTPTPAAWSPPANSCW